MDRNVTLNYNSTLAGSSSVLVLTCEGDIPAVSIIKQIITVTCHSSGNWIPDPAQFTCSRPTTVPSGTEILIHSSGSKHLSHYLYAVVLLSRVNYCACMCFL